MLANTSLMAFPGIAVAAVAAAAALGVGLGLLIRQIPGVADAIDGLFIKVGQFLGLVEKQDPALAANSKRLAELRQANSDLIIAQQAAKNSIDENNDALYEQEDAAAQAVNEIVALEKAAATVAPTMDKTATATAGATSSFSALSKSAAALGPIIGEFIDDLDKADIAQNLTKQAGPIKAAVETISNAFKGLSIGIKVELPKITQGAVDLWVKFFNAVKGFGVMTVGLTIDLPAMTTHLITVWESFFKMLDKHAGKVVTIGIDFGKLPPNMMTSAFISQFGKLINLLVPIAGRPVSVSVDLPNISDGQVKNWEKFFNVFKGGKLEVPEVGTMQSDISSVAASLKSLVQMKGVLWA
jgi:hypothetical protein